MCLIKIGKVVKVEKQRALCDFDGVLKEVSIALLPMIKVGDDVVVNSGFASEIIKNKKALYRDMISTDSLSLQVLNAIERECKNIHQKEIKIAIFSAIQNKSIEKFGLEKLLFKKIKLINAPNGKSISFMNSYIEKNKLDGAISSIYIFENKKNQNNFIFTDNQPIDILKSILKLLININQKEKYE